MPKTCPHGGVREASWPDSQTTSTGSSQHRRVAALLWALLGYLSSSRYGKGWAQPPYEGNSFLLLVFASLCIWLLPKAHNHRWYLQRGLTGKQRPCLLAQLCVHHNRPDWHPQLCKCCLYRLTISWSSLREDPGYLNLSTWDIYSCPIYGGQSTLFWLRIMVSDLEVLIFISASSHELAYCSSDSCRSVINEAKRTSSSANSRYCSGFLRNLNLIPSSPGCCSTYCQWCDPK